MIEALLRDVADYSDDGDPIGSADLDRFPNGIFVRPEVSGHRLVDNRSSGRFRSIGVRERAAFQNRNTQRTEVVRANHRVVRRGLAAGHKMAALDLDAASA